MAQYLLPLLLATTILGCSLFDGRVPPSATTNAFASDGILFGLIEVTWDLVEKAESYTVCRSTANDGTYFQIAVVALPPFNDTDVVEGSVYWYKVQACNKAGCGEFSLSDAGYVRPEPPPPPA